VLGAYSMLRLGPELFELLNAKQLVGNLRPAVYGTGGQLILDIQLIEAKLGFPVPEDFAFLLQNIRDPGDVLFPWAAFKKQQYDDMIAYVRDGMEFSVKHGLWLQRWGDRPSALSQALEIVRNDFATWPKLLPICGHRFLAAEPARPNNPVFSIRGADIVYYGANLAHYLVNEFIDRDPDHHARHTYEQKIQRIEIWSDFADDQPDFLHWDQTRAPDLAKLASAILARSEREVPRSLIELKLQADGSMSVGGEMVPDAPTFEAKLWQLIRQIPPPDLRMGQETEPLNPKVLEQYHDVLQRNGYSIVLLLKHRENEVLPVSGTVWRFNP
jgi:hypothetical protein